MKQSQGSIGQTDQAYRQAVVEAKGGAKILDQTTLDLNGLDKSDATRVQHVATANETLADELLPYHHKFSHISFDRLRDMAKQNVIPRRLAKALTSACTSCLYDTATRKAWRGKCQKDWKQATKSLTPGQFVSVDHLISQPQAWWHSLQEG